MEDSIHDFLFVRYSVKDGSHSFTGVLAKKFTQIARIGMTEMVLNKKLLDPPMASIRM